MPGGALLAAWNSRFLVRNRVICRESVLSLSHLVSRPRLENDVRLSSGTCTYLTCPCSLLNSRSSNPRPLPRIVSPVAIGFRPQREMSKSGKKGESGFSGETNEEKQSTAPQAILDAILCSPRVRGDRALTSAFAGFTEKFGPGPGVSGACDRAKMPMIEPNRFPCTIDTITFWSYDKNGKDVHVMRVMMITAPRDNPVDREAGHGELPTK